MSQGMELPEKILIVDDDPSIGQRLEAPLSKYNITVLKAADIDTALYHFNQNRLHVVCVELEFAPLPGLALIQKWRNHDQAEKRACSFIALSGNRRNSSESNLIKEIGDLQVIAKPFTAIQILPLLSRAFAAKKRQLQFQEMKEHVINYYEKSKNFEKAAQQVQEKIPQLGSQGISLLQDLYERAEKYEEALNIVNGLLEKDKQNISHLNTKGRLLMRLGRYKEAEPILEKADQLAPQNIDRITEMATMYLHLNKPDQSVAKFKELINLNPENPELKFDMFAQLYDFGFDEHAHDLGKATTKPIEIVRHYNNKGVMLSKQGKIKEALTEYRRALQFYPKFKENYRIHFNIALALIQLKSSKYLDEAQENLEKCVELNPKFEKGQQTLTNFMKKREERAS